MKAGENASPRPARPTTKHRIFVVEDHAFMRKSIVGAIDREPELTVCGEAVEAHEAARAIVSLRPDLVLTDLELKSSSGIELIETLHALRPDLPVVATTMFDMGTGHKALSAGATRFVSKQEGPEALIRIILETLHPTYDEPGCNER